MVRAMSRHGEDEGERAAGGGRGPGVSFGFETVAESEKAPRVRRVFESVAGRYDLMNDLMSGGVHRMWKQAFVDWLAPRPGQGLLDVAGGTGDIAFRVIERVGRARVGAIVVCDLTPEMVAQGRDRAIDRGILPGGDCPLYWAAGDAEALPVAESSVEAYTIAFGLRNVTHIEGALAEARRVLKPGGRFLCLEFSQVVVPLVDRLYDLYSFKVLPALGEAVTGDRDAYQYLVESIRRFPPQDELAAMMEAAGLERVSYRNLSGGIAAMHSAWRI
jgi:demethylmenaquinone methyltransferase/2-methoxy-6-polyprenyl-1,4-benzoquinol methylase